MLLHKKTYYIICNETIDDSRLNFSLPLKQQIGEESNDLPFCCGNQIGIKLIKNPTNHECTKHINVYYNFVREKYECNVFYISTPHQVADVLTKDLSYNKFEKLRADVGMLYDISLLKIIF